MSIETIFALFDRHGDESYGEDITQREHALQVAWLTRQAGEPDTLVIAALLHDIGQLLDDAGDVAASERRDARHEISGAAFLDGLLPDAVIAPIRLHVAAKRYLCAVDATYAATLSAASSLSLNLQGGPFTLQEAEAFSHLPFAAEATRLRLHDDQGKRFGLQLPDLWSYRPIIATLMP